MFHCQQAIPALNAKKYILASHIRKKMANPLEEKT